MPFRKVHRVRLEFGSGIRIFGLSETDRLKVKRNLTFNNPAYASAQRFSRREYTNIPPYLTYYKETSEYIEVPAGYEFAKFFPDYQVDFASIVDSRVYEFVNVPKFLLELRDSQKEAAEAFLERSAKSRYIAGSIQMPTGKGKSILGLYLASKLSVKTLIVVHKDDLVTGWQKDIKLAFGGKVTPGLIKAKKRDIGYFLTIATVQTLNRLSPEELAKLYTQFGLVIQDEMHHCPASSFGVVANFKSRFKIGLTATPERTDGLDHIMTLYFGGFCYQYKYDSEDTDILPAKVIVRNTGAYFNPLCEVKRLRGSNHYKLIDLSCPEDKVLSEGQLRLSEIPYAVRPKVSFQVVDDYVVRDIKEFVCEDIIAEYDKGHSCVVFFTQKEHCRLYYEYLRESISEEHLGLYYGDNPNNDAVLERAERVRKFVTLTTYAKTTEGTNVKQWEVEFLVSSINNEKNTEQAVGRIRRTKDGKLNPVLVYDYRSPKAYSLSSHGATRDKRYSQLQFTFEGLPSTKRSLFSRGYK